MDVSRSIRALFLRDRMILNNPYHPAVAREVNLHWFRFPGSETNNLGDYLSTVVYAYMLAQKGIDPHQKVPRTRHLIGIGSVLSQGFQNATVWGTGLIRQDSPKYRVSLRIKKLDIRAVRGPLTRQVLLRYGIRCPEVYGDPAILLPLICPKPDVPRQYDVTLIEHYAARLTDPAAEGLYRLNIQTEDYRSFVQELAASRLVISSSLHGIILAESYGIPAIWLGAPNLDGFKFQDWYHSTGRTCIRPAGTLDEALSMTPPPLPDLTAMRAGLIECFPTDLWKSE